MKIKICIDELNGNRFVVVNLGLYSPHYSYS